MAEPPELWMFVLSNISLFVVSSTLAGLSFLAYRRWGRQTSYQIATVGFCLVVLGGLVEPVYQLIVRGDYYVTGTELLLLQACETILFALGLGALFYAITRQNARSDLSGSEQISANQYTLKMGYREDD